MKCSKRWVTSMDIEPGRIFECLKSTHYSPIKGQDPSYCEKGDLWISVLFEEYRTDRKNYSYFYSVRNSTYYLWHKTLSFDFKHHFEEIL
jgi:hypothetical protein